MVDRLLASLRAQRHQPAEIVVSSLGSTPEVNADLLVRCATYGARLLAFGDPSDPWNMPLAYNAGIRSTTSKIVLTTGADFIFSQSLLGLVWDVLSRHPRSICLCQSSDLSRATTEALPTDSREVIAGFPDLLRDAKPHSMAGDGAIQAAPRQFWFDVRGYDEDFLWWGSMDNDLVIRAGLYGLKQRWMHERGGMVLHQWHPRKHTILKDPVLRRQAHASWARNYHLKRQRCKTLVRNPESWGGAP